MKKEKYVFVQDDDSHWYYIKEEVKDEFNQICNKAYESDDFDEFLEKFQNNMINCHPSNFHDFYNEDGSSK